jgi:hypothetical protein
LAAYTKGNNFSPNLSDPVTARYQREAASGLRATIGVKINRVTEPLSHPRPDQALQKRSMRERVQPSGKRRETGSQAQGS